MLWLNGNPATQPGTLWVNTYRKGASQGEYRFAPTDYETIIGASKTAPTLASGFHTYTIDWQPEYVSW